MALMLAVQASMRCPMSPSPLTGTCTRCRPGSGRRRCAAPPPPPADSCCPNSAQQDGRGVAWRGVALKPSTQHGYKGVLLSCLSSNSALSARSVLKGYCCHVRAVTLLQHMAGTSAHPAAPPGHRSHRRTARRARSASRRSSPAATRAQSSWAITSCAAGSPCTRTTPAAAPRTWALPPRLRWPPRAGGARLPSHHCHMLR